MSKHAILAPSAASRWMLCPGSAEAALAVPEAPPGEAAIAGTLMHEHAAAILTDSELPRHPLDDTEQHIVDTYCHYVRALSGPDVAVSIETRVTLPHISPLLWGTSDMFAWWLHDRRLAVADFKTGYHAVSPVANWQMITYAEGVLRSLKLPEQIEVDAVTLAIVQPRIKSLLSTWTIDGAAFAQFVARLAQGAKDAASLTAVRIPGPVQCTWCPAAALCPERSLVGTLAVSGYVLDEDERMGWDDALTANAKDIYAEVRAAQDRVKAGDGPLQLVTRQEIRWTRDGRAAVQERYGARCKVKGSLMSPRLARRLLDIPESDFAAWTNTIDRVLEATVGHETSL